MDESIDYCREVESYLCKKNGGHLVRIVGPAFEQVQGLGGAGHAVEGRRSAASTRTCDRHNAKPGRRRPLRIEFCEADVLKAFDDWRRAIGTSESAGEASRVPQGAARRAHRARGVNGCWRFAPMAMTQRSQRRSHRPSRRSTNWSPMPGRLAVTRARTSSSGWWFWIRRSSRRRGSRLTSPRWKRSALEAHAELAPYAARMSEGRPEARDRGHPRTDSFAKRSAFPCSLTDGGRP